METLLHTNTDHLPEEGEFMLLDKPLDWTSFDVVAKIRATYKRGGIRKYKVGHTGTLDPKATGLLILATGRKTRQIPSLEGADKLYEATIKLGAQTVSHDTETEEFGQMSVAHLSEDAIFAAAASLVGPRLQQAPMHSATWHNGKRLYELARKGEVVKERKAKEIEILSFEVTAIELPYVHCRIHVTKGAYIRVIAHELGELLGVGAYLSALRRTGVGPYRVEAAMQVEEARAYILRQLGVDGEEAG